MAQSDVIKIFISYTTINIMSISYSMCWEDPLVLNKALRVKKSDKVLSIVSGGENIFALLLKNPKQIIGIDLKKEQIYLTKLKIEAMKNLNYEEFVRFLGFKDSHSRISVYHELKKDLTKEEISFWNQNVDVIKKGIVHSGKLEKYLNSFRKLALPIIISKKNMKRFLNLSSKEAQVAFYDKYWNTRRFKFLFKMFFSKKGLKSGRDKKYFEFSDKGNISSHYLKRVEHALKNIPIKTNYFMQYLLTGTITTPFEGHPYLDKDNFQSIKEILKKDKLRLIHSDVKGYLLRENKQKFSKFNLSDIFESQTIEEYQELLKAISQCSSDNGIACYWNNLAKRDEHKNIKKIRKNKSLSRKLYGLDRVHFYSNFIVEDIN